MIWALEPVPDGNLAGDQVDDLARDEEGADAAWTAFLQDHRVLGDAVDAADAGTDQHAGCALVLMRFGFPAGIGQRFVGGRDAVEDEVADLAQFLRLEHGLGIEGAAGAIAARNDVGDLARKVVHFELGDAAGGAAAG